MNNLKYKNFNNCATKRRSTPYRVLNTCCVLIVIFLSCCFIFAGKISQAQITKGASDKLSPMADVYGANSGSNVTNISQVIASIIQYALSFLGVIFLSLLIYAGFLWMTAAGDSEKITKAKDILQSSIIGLIIILSSYTITYFVLQNLTKAAGTYY